MGRVWFEELPLAHWLQSYNLENLRFLLVDENEHMRGILTGVLRTLGVRYIRAASDGDGALEALAKEVPDIVLTGIGLKPKSGICLITEIREGRSGAPRTLPIIVVTSYTEAAYVRAARDAGIDEFVAKPISVRGLYNRIVSIIQKRRPFVDAPEYFGPDRRRHQEEGAKQHRRKADEPAKALDFSE